MCSKTLWVDDLVFINSIVSLEPLGEHVCVLQVLNRKREGVLEDGKRNRYSIGCSAGRILRIVASPRVYLQQPVFVTVYKVSQL